MFGFVAYQLWGTGIETARAQDQLENQFEQIASPTSRDVDPGTDRRAVDVAATTPHRHRAVVDARVHGPRRAELRPRPRSPPGGHVPDGRAGTGRAEHPADRARPGARQARDPEDRQGRQRRMFVVPACRSTTSRRARATTPRRPCPASSATPRSPATAPRSAQPFSTSTSSHPATRSSSRCSPATASCTRSPRPRSSGPTTTTSSPPPTRRSRS